MGQIVSSILGYIFEINGNNKKGLPDLEGRRSQTDHSQAILLTAASSFSSSSSSSSSSRSCNCLECQQDDENWPVDDEVGEWLECQQDEEKWPVDDEVGEEELGRLRGGPVVEQDFTNRNVCRSISSHFPLGEKNIEKRVEELTFRQLSTLIHRLQHLPPASAFSMITNDDDEDEDEEIRENHLFQSSDETVIPQRAPRRRRRRRRRTRMQDHEIRWIKHYSSNQKILLVGEGDFSFSSCLASAFGSASNIIATSLDSQEFLRKNYRKVISNIQNLKNRGAMVMHEVNVRKMANHPSLKDLQFDRIIYNFPLAGFFPDESRDSNLRRNRKLVAKFLGNARKLLHEDGDIHIAHKCNVPGLEWNIESLGSNYGLRLLEEVPFHRRDYPNYSTKRGFGGDKAFDCNPSKTYKFALN